MIFMKQKSIVIIENNIIATNTIRFKLTSVLVEEGYNVTVLTTGPEKELQLARSRGFHIIDVKSSGGNPIDILRYIRNLWAALRNNNTDVCLTFTIRPAIWGNIVTRLLKIPTITNITGIGPLFESNNIVYRAARILYKFVLKKTARIFFQNYDDMDLFLKRNFADPAKVERVPGSGIEYEYFKPLPKSSNGFSFLFISRLVKDKGIVEYVEAARLLKKDYPFVQFKVLGPLWLQNLKKNTVTQGELNSWIKEGIIVYLGEQTDVRPFIADCDCVVLPSYREGTSNVLLEASSMERPCISCDTTGCKEIIDNEVTGFLCEVANSVDLADKMVKMLTLSPERITTMGINARKKVIREFDKKLVINAYLKAIEKL